MRKFIKRIRRKRDFYCFYFFLMITGDIMKSIGVFLWVFGLFVMRRGWLSFGLGRIFEKMRWWGNL